MWLGSQARLTARISSSASGDITSGRKPEESPRHAGDVLVEYGAAGAIMKKTVYIETTVPSAYATKRTDPHALARRHDTREWWRTQRPDYECFISQEVLAELDAGDFPGRREALELVGDMPLLEINDEVQAIAEVYVRDKLMPGPAGGGDSLHLAIASYHEVDFLLTWNIRHLANPNKVEHLVALNRRLALITPAILTPDMLWAEET